jgi:hypothetical protein
VKRYNDDSSAAAVYGYIMTYNTTDNFYVLGNGEVAANGVWYGSDSSIKTNVVTIPNALAKVKKLRGVNFVFNNPDAGMNDGRLNMGLIAQEVARVVPEVVKPRRDGIQTVNYPSLVGLLIEAIKTQQGQLDSLKQQINQCCNAANRTMQGTGGLLNPGTLNSTATTTVSSGEAENSTTAKLYQNNPNPWNQTTVVKCYVPTGTQNASLMVFDLNGTLKNTFPINGTGVINISINANQLISGMYYYTLIVDGNEVDTKKMILTQ